MRSRCGMQSHACRDSSRAAEMRRKKQDAERWEGRLHRSGRPRAACGTVHHKRRLAAPRRPAGRNRADVLSAGIADGNGHPGFRQHSRNALRAWRVARWKPRLRVDVDQVDLHSFGSRSPTGRARRRRVVDSAEQQYSTSTRVRRRGHDRGGQPRARSSGAPSRWASAAALAARRA